MEFHYFHIIPLMYDPHDDEVSKFLFCDLQSLSSVFFFTFKTYSRCEISSRKFFTSFLRCHDKCVKKCVTYRKNKEKHKSYTRGKKSRKHPSQFTSTMMMMKIKMRTKKYTKTELFLLFSFIFAMQQTFQLSTIQT